MARVLLVEDSEAVRDMLELVLEQEGYQVSTACNGDEALSAVRRSVPDAVITDLVMPGTDGVRLCQSLKGDADFDDVPVIAISGAGWREDLCGCCDAFISKPVDGEHLIDTLRGLELGHFVKHSRGSLRW